jgi:phosphatidylglycerophosphate synthase
MSVVLQPSARATQQELATRFAAEAERASVLLAFGLLVALTASLAFRALTPLALAGPLLLGVLAFQLRAFGSTRSRLPNLVTALRVLLTSLLALDPGSTLGASRSLQAGVIALVFTLDGLDGRLARRLDASSLQGARFDVEADGYLVLVVCSLHALAGLGGWVLIGGLLRYAYVLARWRFRGRDEPRLPFARYAFCAALTALTLALVAPGALGPALAALGTAILIASFSRSFLWTFRG